jgi:PAS domain-containing protein
MITEMSVPPGVQERRQKNLVLILAREFAAKLAMSTFVADADGRLVYFNEPAEELLGRSFAETGEVPIEEWALLFNLREDDGTPLPPERRPGRTALLERRPVHHDFSITSLDGVTRPISSTAFPLFSRPDEVVGVMSIFWERQSG